MPLTIIVTVILLIRKSLILISTLLLSLQMPILCQLTPGCVVVVVFVVVVVVLLTHDITWVPIFQLLSVQHLMSVVLKSCVIHVFSH